MPIHGQHVAVWWSFEGQGNTVEVSWNGGHSRSFRGSEKAMAFLKTLPIDSYVKPSGEFVGRIQVFAPFEADPALIFDELEKIMTPKAYSLK